eukprot:COSAG06_NODE_7138_length_2616_cov_2.280095_3_plen_167_part_00
MIVWAVAAATAAANPSDVGSESGRGQALLSRVAIRSDGAPRRTNMGDEDDFHARAMAMYQARGKAETAEAAKLVKKSVKKEASDELEKDDYRAAAAKLYKLQGPEKLCEECSSDSGKPGARKKNAFYGMPNDRGLCEARSFVKTGLRTAPCKPRRASVQTERAALL